MRQENIYKYNCKGKGQYINIEIGNDEILHWVQENIDINKGDKVILQIIRKKD